jgi:hypothetical protein
MIYELHKIIGYEDKHYNEIIEYYKESICRKVNEPQSPPRKSLVSEDNSPTLSKSAMAIKKELKKGFRARFEALSRSQSFIISKLSTPQEIVKYSDNYNLLQSLKISKYFR